jgi:ribosome-associated protein
MFEIAPGIALAPEEFAISYARSGGPGGQNVNKVNSKVILRWNPGRSGNLPADVLARLLVQQKSRLTTEGDLVITSQKTRDQGRNLEDCLEKVREIVKRALEIPRARKKTRPSRGAKERRLSTKRLHGRRKESRQRPGRDE